MESRLREYYEKQSTFNSFQGKGGRIDGKKKGTKGELYDSYWWLMNYESAKKFFKLYNLVILYPDKKGKKQLLIGLPIKTRAE